MCILWLCYVDWELEGWKKFLGRDFSLKVKTCSGRRLQESNAFFGALDARWPPMYISIFSVVLTDIGTTLGAIYVDDKKLPPGYEIEQ